MPLDGRKVAMGLALEGHLRVTEAGEILISDKIDAKARKAIEGYLNPDLLTPHPPKVTAVNKKYALGAIRRAWRGQGGAKSPIGWPIGRYVKVNEGADGSFKARFRSGTMTVSADGRTLITTVRNYVKITLVGLECQIRQETEDELYGVVAIAGPSDNHLKTFRFPGAGESLTLGPDGQRIWQTALELYNEKIEDLYITCNLIERDSGDVDAISKNLAQKVSEAFSAVMAGMTGVSAESAISEETWFEEGIGTAFGLVLDGILGIGDDPYNPAAVKIGWDEIVGGVDPQPPYRRSDDPRTISAWTHRLVVTGTDDGGDQGQYAFYFNVETYNRGETMQTGLDL